VRAGLCVRVSALRAHGRPPLSSHTGRASGEKKLRALLCRTAQWRCAVAREGAARRADADALPDLAHALRAHNLALLRKRTFLALCGYWGLCCDIWAPAKPKAPSRRAAARDAPPPPPPPPPHAPQPPLPLPPPLPDDGAVVALVRRDVGGAVATFRLFQHLPGLSAAAAAEPYAPISTLDFHVRPPPLHPHGLPCCPYTHQRARMHATRAHARGATALTRAHADALSSHARRSA
jgi:hypothetical protein